VIEHHFDLFRLELLADLASEYAFCQMDSRVFVEDLALRYRWIIPVSHDVVLRLP